MHDLHFAGKTKTKKIANDVCDRLRYKDQITLIGRERKELTLLS